MITKDMCRGCGVKDARRHGYYCSICRDKKDCIRISQNQNLPEHTGNRTCEVCNPPVGQPISIELGITYTKEWWDHYNGF